MIKNDPLFEYNRNKSILRGAEKWPYPPYSFFDEDLFLHVTENIAIICLGKHMHLFYERSLFILSTYLAVFCNNQIHDVSEVSVPDIISGTKGVSASVIGDVKLIGVPVLPVSVFSVFQ